MMEIEPTIAAKSKRFRWLSVGTKPQGGRIIFLSDGLENTIQATISTVT
jgi:hypothetical protein